MKKNEIIVRIIQKYLYLFLFITLLASNTLATTDKQTNITIMEQQYSIMNEQRDDLLNVDLTDITDGIKISIHYTNKKNTKKNESKPPAPAIDIPVSGHFTITLDEMIFSQQNFQGEELNVDQVIDATLISNGMHKIKIEVMSYPGGSHVKEVAFHYNATPTVEIGSLGTNDGIFEPTVNLWLPGAKGHLGQMEIFIDEISRGSCLLGKQNLNKVVKISDLLKRQLNVSSLPRGKHLLRVTIVTETGDRCDVYAPFEIDIMPQVNIEKNQDGTFRSVTADFSLLQSDLMGSIDVFYNRGIIFSKQAKNISQLTINRKEINNALKHYKIPIAHHSINLVLAVRSRNGSEEWLKVDF